MKKSLALAAGVAVLLLAAATERTLAAGESITITGEGKCAKCALKETKECQNVIQTEKDGRTVSYYLVANDVSKEPDFLPNPLLPTGFPETPGDMAPVLGEWVTLSRYLDEVSAGDYAPPAPADEFHTDYLAERTSDPDAPEPYEVGFAFRSPTAVPVTFRGARP